MIAVSTLPATPISDGIAARALELRERKKLTRAVVAAAAEMSVASLRNFEDRRRREIGVDELDRLAGALGYSIAELSGIPFRGKPVDPVEDAQVPAAGVGVVSAVRDDIEAFGDLIGVEPSLAQTAYVLAAAIDDREVEPRVLPSLVKELRAVLDDIRNGRDTGGDDDLAGMDTPD